MVRIHAAALLWAGAQISSGGNSAASDTRTLLPLLGTHQHDASRTSLAHIPMPLFTGVRGSPILRTSALWGSRKFGTGEVAAWHMYLTLRTCYGAPVPCTQRWGDLLVL